MDCIEKIAECAEITMLVRPTMTEPIVNRKTNQEIRFVEFATFLVSSLMFLTSQVSDSITSTDFCICVIISELFPCTLFFDF